jgi:hypothetical protein
MEKGQIKSDQIRSCMMLGSAEARDQRQAPTTMNDSRGIFALSDTDTQTWSTALF